MWFKKHKTATGVTTAPEWEGIQVGTMLAEPPPWARVCPSDQVVANLCPADGVVRWRYIGNGRVVPDVWARDGSWSWPSS